MYFSFNLFLFDYLSIVEVFICEYKKISVPPRSIFEKNINNKKVSSIKKRH